jgi:uncharacterized protein RhaS with RHS repeats
MRTSATVRSCIGIQLNAIGRRTQLTVSTLATITYGYDNNSRLTAIVRGAQTVGLDYDDAGRRTLLRLANGVRTEYQYDTASTAASRP